MNKSTNRCEKCYTYRGECVEFCPINTKLNLEEKTCDDIQFNKLDRQNVFLFSGLAILLAVGVGILIMAKGYLKVKDKYIKEQVQQKKEQQNLWEKEEFELKVEDLF